MSTQNRERLPRWVKKRMAVRQAKYWEIKGIIMPEISRFLGIVIAMYYREHQPPHFHAKYGEQTGIFSVAELKLIEGSLPPRVISLVLEWAFQHRDELMGDWQLAMAKKALRKIAPLV